MLLAGVLCLIVSISIAVFQLPMIVIELITLVLIVPLYIALLYSPIWTEGDRNRNMVQFGHLVWDKYKGLKIGLFLMIPYFIENVFLTLSWAKVIPDIFWIYKILNSHLWPIMTWLNPIQEGNWISINNMSVLSLIICWIFMFYPLIISVIAYFLGYKGISVSEKLIYKNKPRKKRHY